MTLFRFSPELDPVSGMLALQRELERVFEHPSLQFDRGLSGRGQFPPVNVFAGQDGYVVKMEVPGVAPEDINIEAHDRALVVRGKREAARKEGGGFHRRERESGQFSRSLQLPDDLDLTRAEASCKHGVLTVRIPKREEKKPRQISVKAA